MNSSDKPASRTPAPRRIVLTTVVNTPVITPRRLKLPPHDSNAHRARSAPRRLVSSRVKEHSPTQLKHSFRFVDHSDEPVVPTKLSPFDHISHTPASTDNDNWLKQFGIDISLLRIYDSDEDTAQLNSNEENEHPNLTPTHDVNPLESLVQSEPSAMSSATMSSRTPTSPTTEQKPGDVQPVTPRRLHSSARSRRQSVKISQREIISLVDEKAPLETLSQQSQPPSQPKQLSFSSLSAHHDKGGSNVFLTPVRASRKQRLELGADTVVTPVRRSLRLSKRGDNLAPVDQPQARARMLEQFGFTYIPNQSLR